MAKKDKKIDLTSLPTNNDSQIGKIMDDIDGLSSSIQMPARIVSVPLSQVIPDRFHPRVILPSNVKKPFFSNEIDCYEAAKMLIEYAKQDQSLRSQVKDLLALGHSILDNYQIQPAYGYWGRNESGEHYLFLEVGSRRFWGLALAYVEEGLEREPTIEVAEGVESAGFRQIVENVHTLNFCAIDLARAIASLILLRNEIIPEQKMDAAGIYFRKALSIKRISNSTWNAISQILNRTPDVLKQHIQFLTLSESFQYHAALHRLSASVLQEIINAPKENQSDMLSAALEKSRLFFEDESISTPSDDAPRKRTDDLGKTSRAGVQTNYVLNWFEVAENSSQPGEFLDVAQEISTRIKTSEELDLIARRLSNLARDIRVVKTRRLFN
ncbi:MAG: hypothetical protein N2C13_01815 [Chloroflexota bacterium]